jgi:hypothetical protein
MSWLDRLSRVPRVLGQVGFEKERAALALLPLGFFVSLYTVIAVTAPPGWTPAFAALAGCYLMAFLAVASQWFWGRWFASGLGWSGFMVGLGLIFHPDIGWNPLVGAYTIMHGAVIALLMGAKMAANYELQPAWRERFSMDEYGVARLGKTVTRASASLPTLILWALAPRTGQAIALAAAAAVVVGACGLAGILRMRTWGAVALLAAGMIVGAGWLFTPGPDALAQADVPAAALWTTLGAPGLALGLLAWATLPLVRPAWRFLRG